MTRKTRLRVLTSLLLAAGYVQAQWVSIGPSGATGSVSTILVTARGLYSASPGAGVFRSLDHGLSWFPSDSGITSPNVTALTATSQFMFASTGGRGVFKSLNGGATWWPTSPIVIPQNILISNNVNTIQAVGNILMVAPDIYGAFYSSDQGVTWLPSGRGLALETVNTYIGADSIILAGTAAHGIFRTTDPAGTWQNVWGGSLTTADVKAFADDGSRLYAGTFGKGLLESTDGGLSWNPCAGGPPSAWLLSLAVMSGAGGPSTLFAGTSNAGLFRSTDGGATWSGGGPQVSENTVSFLLARGSTIYMGTRDGVYISTDGGTQWTLSNAGYNSSTVNALAIADGQLLAGAENGFFLSTNRGVNWTSFADGLKGSPVNAVAAAGAVLAAGTATEGFLVRGQADTAWSRTLLIGDWISAALGAGSTLVASPMGDGAYYSRDGGATWQRGAGTEPGQTGTIIQAFAEGGGHMYAASYGKGAFVSSDSGATWRIADFGMRDYHAHACTVMGTIAFLATEVGVFTSPDFADNWYFSNGEIGNHSVIAMTATTSVVFAGTADAGLFVSADSGAHWHVSNAGLASPRILSLTTDGRDVYAGTAGGGVFRRPVAEIMQTLGAPLAIGDQHGAPRGYALEQNYPNPFNPGTKIQYEIGNRQHIILNVYDVLGREVATLVNEVKQPGTYAVEFDGSRLASGVYVYRLTAGASVISRRMVLLR